MAALSHVPITETDWPGLGEGPTCTTWQWGSHGSWKEDFRLLGPEEGEGCQLGASLLLCAGTIIPDWKPLPSPESWVAGNPVVTWAACSAPWLFHILPQNLAHLLLPQEVLPDCSGSFHGSNKSISLHMCEMSSVDVSQAA